MRFDELRREKWQRGREERGLGDADGFAGDAAQEIAEEALDLANYADQLYHERRITEEEMMRMHSTAREIYGWAQRV